MNTFFFKKTKMGVWSKHTDLGYLIYIKKGTRGISHLSLKPRVLAKLPVKLYFFYFVTSLCGVCDRIK